MRDPAPAKGVADREVDEGGRLHRDADHFVVDGHVHEQLLERDLLLVPSAEHLGLLHPSDREHGGMVELGVVKPIQEVDRAGPRGRDAHAESSRRLRVAGRHESSRFLVVNEDEADPFLIATQPLHDPIDPVSREAEDSVHPPVDETFDQRLRGDLRHRAPPPRN